MAGLWKILVLSFVVVGHSDNTGANAVKVSAQIDGKSRIDKLQAARAARKQQRGGEVIDDAALQHQLERMYQGDIPTQRSRSATALNTARTEHQLVEESGARYEMHHQLNLENESSSRIVLTENNRGEYYDEMQGYYDEEQGDYNEEQEHYNEEKEYYNEEKEYYNEGEEELKLESLTPPKGWWSARWRQKYLRKSTPHGKRVGKLANQLAQALKLDEMIEAGIEAAETKSNSTTEKPILLARQWSQIVKETEQQLNPINLEGTGNRGEEPQIIDDDSEVQIIDDIVPPSPVKTPPSQIFVATKKSEKIVDQNVPDGKNNQAATGITIFSISDYFGDDKKSILASSSRHRDDDFDDDKDSLAVPMSDSLSHGARSSSVVASGNEEVSKASGNSAFVFVDWNAEESQCDLSSEADGDVESPATTQRNNVKQQEPPVWKSRPTQMMPGPLLNRGQRGESDMNGSSMNGNRGDGPDSDGEIVSDDDIAEHSESEELKLPRPNVTVFRRAGENRHQSRPSGHEEEESEDSTAKLEFETDYHTVEQAQVSKFLPMRKSSFLHAVL